MNTFTKLKGLISIAPKDDIRYYLNGIHVTQTKMTSTCGHVIVTVEHDLPGLTEPVILDRCDLDRKLKMFTKKSECELLVKNGEIHLNEFKLDVIEGRYPDVQRAISRYTSSSDSIIGLDLALVGKVCKAIDVICDSKIKVAEFKNHDQLTGCSIKKGDVSGYIAPCRL